MKILDFPTFRQTYNWDCGPSALQSILAYYGYEVREDKLIKMSGANRDGTSIAGIVKTLEKYDLKCKSESMNIEKIVEFINQKIPVILMVQAWTSKKEVDWVNDWVDGHFVIAIGYDEDKFIFEDPSSAYRVFLSYSELGERWHDVDTDNKKYFNYGIAVYGKESIYDHTALIHMD